MRKSGILVIYYFGVNKPTLEEFNMTQNNYNINTHKYHRGDIVCINPRGNFGLTDKIVAEIIDVTSGSNIGYLVKLVTPESISINSKKFDSIYINEELITGIQFEK